MSIGGTPQIGEEPHLRWLSSFWLWMSCRPCRTNSSSSLIPFWPLSFRTSSVSWFDDAQWEGHLSDQSLFPNVPRMARFVANTFPCPFNVPHTKKEGVLVNLSVSLGSHSYHHSGSQANFRTIALYVRKNALLAKLRIYFSHSKSERM